MLLRRLCIVILGFVPCLLFAEFVPPPTIIPSQPAKKSQEQNETQSSAVQVIEVFKQRSTSYYLTLGLGAAAGRGMSGQSYVYWVMSSRLAARIANDLYVEGGVDHLGYNATLLSARYFHPFSGSKWGVTGGLGGAYMLPRTTYDEETTGLQIDPRTGSKFSTFYFAPSASLYFTHSAAMRFKAEMVGYVAPSRLLVTFLTGVITYF